MTNPNGRTPDDVQPLHVDGESGATVAPKTGTVEIDAATQRKIAATLAALLDVQGKEGHGKKYTAPVLMHLSGEVYTTDGWTNPVSYSQLGKDLGTDWRAVKRAVYLLVEVGLILKIGEPNEHGDRRFQLYGYRYVPLGATVAPTTCNGCTSDEDLGATVARPKSLSADDVDILKGLVDWIKHHQQQPDSKRVQPLHVESGEKAGLGATVAPKMPNQVQPLHVNGAITPEIARRMTWLAEFGVVDPDVCLELAAGPLDDVVLLALMLDHQQRLAENEHRVGIFVKAARRGKDPPPGAVERAKRCLGDEPEAFAAGDLRAELASRERTAFFDGKYAEYIKR